VLDDKHRQHTAMPNTETVYQLLYNCSSSNRKESF